MKTPRKGKLAASFVVTVAALPALASLEGCRKQTVDNDPGSSDRAASTWRNAEGCVMAPPEHCPKGASCNPPPPVPIDCPPSLRDAGDAPVSAARPPGKEDWLRTRPHLWVSRHGCSYSSDQFCAPPPKAYQCAPPVAVVKVPCQQIPGPEGGADAAPAAPRWALEPFVYTDGLGACHKVPAFECQGGDCVTAMPADEPAPCP